MEKIFPEVLRLSMLGGLMVPAVLAVRFFLRRAPKSLYCFLWMLVGIRLLVPFSMESVFGLLPDRGEVEMRLSGERPGDSGGLRQEEQAGQENAAWAGKEETAAPVQNGEGSKQGEGLRIRRQLALKVGSAVWVVGMLFMAGYFFYSWFRIRGCVAGAEPEDCHLEGKRVRILRCDKIGTPFLFGVLHPEIYVPALMDGGDLPYIVLHERAHRRRGDHLVKPFSFFLLAVHWFNPLIWAAFRMLCRDMELACDEMVIRDMKVKDRKAYSRALLNCSVWKEKASACPVAFGELSVKERVRNILNYKKPTVLAVCLGAAVCLVLLLCFMTHRKTEGQSALITDRAGRGETAELPAEEPFLDREGARNGTADADGVEAGTADTGVSRDGESQSGNSGGDGPGERGDQAVVRSQEGRDDPAGEQSRAFVESWARAFCDRDGKALVSLCSEELLEIFRQEESIITVDGDGPGFGWSSPWPWDSEADYQIVSLTENTARILYYAWTSDPHVTVWEEKLTFRIEGERLVMDNSELDFMDNICTGEEFYRACPDGMISGTRMDYLDNGTGKALNDNARANRDFYEPLFAPDTAARFLLNILKNEEKVEITVEDGEDGEDESGVSVSISFILDHEKVSLTMVRPYGEEGIWIPQT